MSERVRCYGGTLHGQFIYWDGQYNFKAADRRFRKGPSIWSRPDPRPTFEPMHSIDTYRIEVYNEQSGEGYRQMRVAILEGRDLFREEQWQLDHDMMTLRKWKPKREPSFLYDFDRWFAWKLYEITGEFRHIREYVRW